MAAGERLKEELKKSTGSNGHRFSEREDYPVEVYDDVEEQHKLQSILLNKFDPNRYQVALEAIVPLNGAEAQIAPTEGNIITLVDSVMRSNEHEDAMRAVETLLHHIREEDFIVYPYGVTDEERQNIRQDLLTYLEDTRNEIFYTTEHII